MDIHQIHLQSDKENFAPSPSNVSYPELPRVSPLKRHNDTIPYKSTKRHHAVPPNSPVLRDSGLLCPSPTLSPNTPSNIGCSRAPGNLAARLQQTPPRASHSDKVKDIFSQAALRSPSTVFFPSLSQEAVTSYGRNDSLVSAASSDSSSNALTSESEIDTRLKRAEHGSNKLHTETKAASMNATAAVWQHQAPLRLIIPDQSSMLQNRAVLSSQPAAPEADSSSDEWTGDEEFLPKDVRRRARMLEAQRAREKKEQARKERDASTFRPTPFMSPEKLCKVAEKSREAKSLLETSPYKRDWGLEFKPKAPGSPSRFTPMWKDPDPDARPHNRSPKKKKKPRVPRASDADDEKDGDPDL